MLLVHLCEWFLRTLLFIIRNTPGHKSDLLTLFQYLYILNLRTILWSAQYRNIEILKTVFHSAILSHIFYQLVLSAITYPAGSHKPITLQGL